MINVHDNYWIPSDGFQYITNGEIYTDSIYLGSADSIDNWHDTNEQPQEIEPVTEETALTRYANELTGADDPDIISAAETMITKLSKED